MPKSFATEDSGVADSRPSIREANVEAFLDAAERLLVREGAAGISTRQLAREAGQNHGLVHYYFGSVDELLLQTLERFTARILERQRAMYETEQPFIEKWRTAMAFIDEDLASGYPKIWAELQALAWNKPELRERLHGVHDRWHDVLRDALAQAIEEYDLDDSPFSAESWAALVAQFNQGLLFERLLGFDRGHEALLTAIDAWLSSLEKHKSGNNNKTSPQSNQSEESTMSAVEIDEAKLEEFMGQFVGDLGAAITTPLVLIGDKLGLYKAMADSEPVTTQELAERTDCHERYIREWLCQQAASGYVEYDAATHTFRLPPEQAMALADENSPAFIPGAFQLVAATVKDESQIAERFRSGEGFGWHEHHHDLFAGTERFFRPGYLANLVDAWLPALDGVLDKLSAGALVADIGCGHGASTILMAKAFPASRFVGSDYHEGSVQAASAAAERAGVSDRVSFEVASAKDFGGGPFDLVCVFDALHDMGDPVGAARHVREQLTSDGTWMVVEPLAGDAIEENLNPVGRIFYGGSTMLCTPASLSQEVGLALGAQAGEQRLTEVLGEGGFSRVRRAAETPFNLVLEGRP